MRPATSAWGSNVGGFFSCASRRPPLDRRPSSFSPSPAGWTRQSEAKKTGQRRLVYSQSPPVAARTRPSDTANYGSLRPCARRRRTAAGHQQQCEHLVQPAARPPASAWETWLTTGTGGETHPSFALSPSARPNLIPTPTRKSAAESHFSCHALARRLRRRATPASSSPPTPYRALASHRSGGLSLSRSALQVVDSSGVRVQRGQARRRPCAPADQVQSVPGRGQRLT